MASKSPPFITQLTPAEISLVPQNKDFKKDKYERYKIEQLQIQKRSSSIYFLNLKTVAKQMQIPASYLIKYMGYDFSSKIFFDPKKPNDQMAYIKGDFDEKKLSRSVFNFIADILLCPKCHFPEVNLSIEQDSIFGKCRACGVKEKRNIRHDKFIRFIKSNPPKSNNFSGNASKSTFDDDSDDISFPRGNFLLQEIEIKSTSKNNPSKSKNNSSKSKNDLSKSTKITNEKNRLKEQIEDLIQRDNPKSLLNLTRVYSVSKNDLLSIVFEVFFSPELTNDCDKFITHAETRVKFLVLLCQQDEKIQEIFCGKLFFLFKIHSPKNIFSKLPIVFQFFYQHEVLDEINILNWYHQNEKEIDQIQILKPFIDFLEQEEEETDEE